MPVELSAVEARVIGCLMEKSVITPDQYPLTLNALTAAHLLIIPVQCEYYAARSLRPVMGLAKLV